MIDRNLGAEAADLSCKAYGCYYQVGRKDPLSDQTLHNSNQEVLIVWDQPGYGGVRVGFVLRLCRTPPSSEYSPSGEPMSQMKASPDITTWRPIATNILCGSYHVTSSMHTSTATSMRGYTPRVRPTSTPRDNFKNNEFEYTNPVAYSSGPFGYCLSTEAVASNKAMAMTNGAYDYPETHDAWATLASRREAGDYYEVDEYNGRRYHTVALSAHGDEIITCFPTSGALSETGQYHSVGFNFALWASGRVEPLNGEDYSETRYDAHWFGIKDNWSSDWKESYDTEWDDTGDWRIYCPYLRDDANYSARINLINNPIGTAVYGIGTPAMEIDESGHHSALGKASNYAVPVRCIRQYDSTAGRSSK